ncbi:hypothetical protein NEF87_000201 [Candidatus Lokiarchaeum ossiferum]|uniref:Uncharacterized protein n=1 Tax=Candidatus Lokiarchaeum ossiferum TaxID=2951803 RepID=A0ABY6HK73_9ARCH|nr:hypothetical protein NEF87_000201 [Candidatus Lokiarchaeum sp. B-35]
MIQQETIKNTQELTQKPNAKKGSSRLLFFANKYATFHFIQHKNASANYFKLAWANKVSHTSFVPFFVAIVIGGMN